MILTGLGLLGLLLAPGSPDACAYSTRSWPGRVGRPPRSASCSSCAETMRRGCARRAPAGAAVEAEDELEEDDVELDDVPEPRSTTRWPRRIPSLPARQTTVEPGEQVAIDLGPGYRPGT